MELEDMVAGTFLEGAEVAEVDVLAGDGVDELRAALDRLLDGHAAGGRPRPAPAVGRPGVRGQGLRHRRHRHAHGRRRWRSTTTWCVARRPEGAGPGPAEPPGAAATRGAGQPGGGQPVRRRPRRGRPGDALLRPGQWQPTARFDASLRTPGALDHDVTRRGAYLAYIGSGEHPVRVRVLGGDADRPGRRGPGPHPPARRRAAAARRPLRPAGERSGRDGRRRRGARRGAGAAGVPGPPDRSVDRVVAERGWVAADDLERLTGERRAPNVGPLGRVARGAGVGTVAAAGGRRRRRPPRPRRRRARRPPAGGPAALDGVAVEGGRARPGAAADPLADHPFLAALAARPSRRPTRRASTGPSCPSWSAGAWSSSATASTSPRRRWPRPPAGSRRRWIDTPRASPSPRCGTRSAPPAATPCRCWPSSTPQASPAGGATCASAAPAYPHRANLNR